MGGKSFNQERKAHGCKRILWDSLFMGTIMVLYEIYFNCFCRLYGKIMAIDTVNGRDFLWSHKTRYFKSRLDLSCLSCLLIFSKCELYFYLCSVYNPVGGMDLETLCNMVNQMQLSGVERLTIGLPVAYQCQADNSLQNVCFVRSLLQNLFHRARFAMQYLKFGIRLRKLIFRMLGGTSSFVNSRMKEIKCSSEKRNHGYSITPNYFSLNRTAIVILIRYNFLVWFFG